MIPRPHAKMDGFPRSQSTRLGSNARRRAKARPSRAVVGEDLDRADSQELSSETEGPRGPGTGQMTPTGCALTRHTTPSLRFWRWQRRWARMMLAMSTHSAGVGGGSRCGPTCRRREAEHAHQHAHRWWPRVLRVSTPVRSWIIPEAGGDKTRHPALGSRHFHVLTTVQSRILSSPALILHSICRFHRPRSAVKLPMTLFPLFSIF